MGSPTPLGVGSMQVQRCDNHRMCICRHSTAVRSRTTTTRKRPSKTTSSRDQDHEAVDEPTQSTSPRGAASKPKYSARATAFSGQDIEGIEDPMPSTRRSTSRHRHAVRTMNLSEDAHGSDDLGQLPSARRHAARATPRRDHDVDGNEDTRHSASVPNSLSSRRKLRATVTPIDQDIEDEVAQGTQEASMDLSRAAAAKRRAKALRQHHGHEEEEEEEKKKAIQHQDEVEEVTL